MIPASQPRRCPDAESSSYGASEQVAGDIANDLGIRDRIFWATKVNAAGREGLSGAKADSAKARAQIEESFRKFRLAKIDLLQVHDVVDVATHLPIVKELKAAGRVRYIGITSTRENQYQELIGGMGRLPTADHRKRMIALVDSLPSA